MRFKPALYDGSDPLYAPLSFWSGKFRYWRPSPKFIKLGADPTPIHLEGTRGDDMDAARARKARELTRDLLVAHGAGKDVKAGTWDVLFNKFLTDKYSPIFQCGPKTREGYQRTVKRWQPVIGHMNVTTLDYSKIMEIKGAMEGKGRSTDDIKRMFNHLRYVTSYGVALRYPGADDVKAILSNIRFKSGQKRTFAPTRDQVFAMIAEADKRGLEGFALGLSLQWWFALRSVDVRGQWFDVEDNKSGGIVRTSIVKRKIGSHTKTSLWQDGLTWDMIAADFSGFSKVISKTKQSRPDEQSFDLTSLPDIQNRLRLLSQNGRAGPVILSSDGLPYTREGWTNAFRRLREHLALPTEFRSMDIRAGAITEARDRGASLSDMRDMATHADSATTQRYIRGGDEARTRVVKLRMK